VARRTPGGSSRQQARRAPIHHPRLCNVQAACLSCPHDGFSSGRRHRVSEPPLKPGSKHEPLGETGEAVACRGAAALWMPKLCHSHPGTFSV
jgi:hypothetical protein